MNRRYQVCLFTCLAGTLVGGLYQLRETRLRQFSSPSADQIFARLEYKHRQEEAALLPVGFSAPDFVVTTMDGSVLTLTQARQDCKALLVNFGFINCGHCQAELPLLIALRTRMQRKGLAVITIDIGDTRNALRQWKDRNQVNFLIALAGGSHDVAGSVLEQYHVTAYPTNYLIDANGTILWRSVGEADESALRAALSHSGIL